VTGLNEVTVDRSCRAAARRDRPERTRVAIGSSTLMFEMINAACWWVITNVAQFSDLWVTASVDQDQGESERQPPS